MLPTASKTDFEQWFSLGMRFTPSFCRVASYSIIERTTGSVEARFLCISESELKHPNLLVLMPLKEGINLNDFKICIYIMNFI